jgi:superoxide dismutase, Fe-Mn family
MAFKLPQLDYPYDALEPWIDKRTMEIHHTKHHQTYINNLNAAIEGKGVDDKDLRYFVTRFRKFKEVSVAVMHNVRNNSGGHYNHSLFWKMMCPPGTSEKRREELDRCIDSSFGSFDRMVELFNESAAGLFGSGWVWLCYYIGDKTLCIRRTQNQDTICMRTAKLVPILGLDVWEHAYYLKHQSNRKSYIADWWNVVNWGFVNKLFSEVAVKEKPLRLDVDGAVIFD